MLNILYPSVRMGRMISVALPIYEYTGSQELSIASCVLCDLTSIIADSTPFFKNWNQFVMMTKEQSSNSCDLKYSDGLGPIKDKIDLIATRITGQFIRLIGPN